MLPKVGAALKEFVAPVAAASQRRVEQHDRPPQQRQKQLPGKSKEQSKEQPKEQTKDQGAKVIPFPSQAGLAPKAQTALAPKPPVNTAAQSEQSVTQTVMQLLTLFSQQRLVLLRWFGKKTYEASAHGSKKGATLRKGTILDDKAQ